MSLDAVNCKQAFVDAMSPIAGDNVKLDPVQANLGALGGAVLQIATVYATTVSNVNFDPTFWQWIAALDAWQKGVVQAFNNWHPVQPDGQALKTAVLAVTTPPPAPIVMEGGIR